MATNDKQGPFTPYVSTINEDDPIRIKVPMAGMDIGANPASMPKGGVANARGIEHVGDQRSMKRG